MTDWSIAWLFERILFSAAQSFQAGSFLQHVFETGASYACVIWCSVRQKRAVFVDTGITATSDVNKIIVVDFCVAAIIIWPGGCHNERPAPRRAVQSGWEEEGANVQFVTSYILQDGGAVYGI